MTRNRISLGSYSQSTLLNWIFLILLGLTTAAHGASQQAKLTAADAAAGDQFGASVAIVGDTAVVGAHQDADAGANSGSAYVFIRVGTTWSQQAKLTAADAAAGDRFGTSVAISGDTIVVGARADDTFTGSAYVFVRSGTDWSQQAKLTAVDASTGDTFGNSVAIAGDTIIVGAPGDDDPGGSAYVFVRSGTAWSQQAKLTDTFAEPVDQFGVSVAIAGDTAVVGAFRRDALYSNSGAASAFVRSGTNWSQQGTQFFGLDGAELDRFGYSVAVAGDNTVVSGAIGDASNAGSAYIHNFAGGFWNQRAKLIADDASSGDTFGISVSIAGAIAIVGAFNDDDAGTDSGSAYVFVRGDNQAAWSQQAKLTALDAAAGDWFGVSVAIAGDTVVVGARQDDDAGIDSGSAYVFALGTTDDGDGIENLIDGTFIAGTFNDQSADFSNNFTDQHRGGTSFGTVKNRADLDFEITDDPIGGVDVTASGGGSGTAQIDACSSPLVTFNVTDLDSFSILCTSATSYVTKGPVELAFANIIVTAPDGAAVRVTEPSPGRFTIANLGAQGDPTILVNDGIREVVVSPGNDLTVSLDEDGDGVADANEATACLDTAIPEVSVPGASLLKNRYVLSGPRDGSVLTFESTNKTDFTTGDTGGCSCEQIIAELDLGDGHVLFGCSKSVMQKWINQVN